MNRQYRKSVSLPSSRHLAWCENRNPENMNSFQIDKKPRMSLKSSQIFNSSEIASFRNSRKNSKQMETVMTSSDYVKSHLKSSHMNRRKSFPDHALTKLVLKQQPVVKTPKYKWRSLGTMDENLQENNLGESRKSSEGGSSQLRGWGKVHEKITLAKMVANVFNSGMEISRLQQLVKLKDDERKRLFGKFQLAVKLCIVCIRLFKEHSLRNRENDDEVSPFIKGLHFHDYDQPTDLMFDRSKFKANKSMRVSEETKRILCKPPHLRTERELYVAQIALRNIKAIADYPNQMQRHIAQVGQYERYEAKRIVLRQGHPASAHYFVLSGEAVVMVMDDSRTYARPTFHVKRGGEFGELSIIQGTRRNATIICKEPCEFLSISKKDYKRIFMSGGEKSIEDPDQEMFMKSLSFLDGWPMEKLKENPNKFKFLYFRRGDVIAKETKFYDWIIVVKSGSVRVLKKLKKVNPFQREREEKNEYVSEKEKKDNSEKRFIFRRHILSELKIPLRNLENEDPTIEEYPGKPRPFIHPGDVKEDGVLHLPQIKQPRQGREAQPNRNSFQSIQSHVLPSVSETGVLVVNPASNPRRRVSPRAKQSDDKDERRRSSVLEKEKELMGFQEEQRTIQDEIDVAIKRKDPDDLTAADLNPEFVEIQLLTKGQTFGLSDLLLDPQPNFCIVSNGADVVLIDKEFYMQHTTDSLKNRMRQELCPYPTDEEMQRKYQQSVDWSAYRTETMVNTLDFLKQRRELKAALTL